MFKMLMSYHVKTETQLHGSKSDWEAWKKTQNNIMKRLQFAAFLFVHKYGAHVESKHIFNQPWANVFHMHKVL